VEKSSWPVKPIRRKRESQIRVQRKLYLFICSDNEALTVVAMRVSNPDRSPARIHG
jgi:hypothetical protein